MITNMKLGASRATSFINHTSSIFYRPQKYRAIRPRDAGTIIGLVSFFFYLLYAYIFFFWLADTRL